MRVKQSVRRKTPMWAGQLAGNGIWYWFYKPQLPNGWNAGIFDDSQTPTRYAIFAATPLAVVSGRNTAGCVNGTETYESFEDAKREALNLAMAQPDVRKMRRQQEIRRPLDPPEFD